MTPNEAKARLQDFQTKRQHPGGCLHAVLTNDLFGAVRKADETSEKNLVAIAKHVWAEMPGNIWGSPEKVALHLQGPQPKPTGDVRETSLDME